MPERAEIIRALQTSLEPLPFLYALWLEGADANGTLDAYSDLDFWLDFEDSYEVQAIAAVENTLRRLGEIDFQYNMAHSHPKLRQRIYHLKDTSEYLAIDFCWQLHSRCAEEWSFVTGDPIENAKVLFDKRGVVRFVPEGEPIPQEEVQKRLAQCDYAYAQHARVKKYFRRGAYAESVAYYHQYVIEPLVTLLRMKYTPRYPDFQLIHISRHLPKAEAARLESLLKTTGIADLEQNMLRAEAWFAALRREL